MRKIINGTELSKDYRNRLKPRIQALTATGHTPGLAVVLVGEDPASHTYVKHKAKACEELGIYSQQYNLPDSTTQEELLDLIDSLNQDSKIHGILVQLPLPSRIDEFAVIQQIDPNKDVDAFHQENVGAIMIGDYRYLPCTPAGVMELIKSTGISLTGKHAVVVGRSNIVGKPMAMLLLHADATVTICHSKTENLKEMTKQADILVASVGKANFIKADMIKPGAVVIDVGMNRDEDGKLCGDVDFKEAEKVAGALTPVPGGVGPMTITMLMENTVRAAEYFAK